MTLAAMRRLAAIVTAAASVAGLWAAAARAALPTTFTTGIADPVYYQAQTRTAWLDRTVASGARFILLWVSWASVAPQQPAAGTDPSDPANPAYDWGTLDATVKAATARGLTVVLSVTSAPPWAEGPDEPASVAANWPGTWRPNAAAFGAFGKAVARRYSGSFNAGAGTLPRVRYFQAWTEPNYPSDLDPQWAVVKGRLVAASPIIYRSLLNAFYTAVKAVHSSDVVITAGTAPYGDPPGGIRIRPVLFWRDVLCLTTRLAPAPCRNPAHFDILAHDPYDFGPPRVRAYWADEVSLPDLWKLTRVLAAAERSGRALPRIHHSVWVTEFGWNSWPPIPHGVPLLRRARWVDEAFYELWRQGIGTATWYLIADQPRSLNGSYAAGSGLYYGDGRRKAGLEAFRFPFVAMGAGSERAQVWAVSPDTGTIRVQAFERGRWTTVLRLGVRVHGVIDRTIAISGRPQLRAVIASDVSLGWQA